MNCICICTGTSTALCTIYEWCWWWSHEAGDPGEAASVWTMATDVPRTFCPLSAGPLYGSLTVAQYGPSRILCRRDAETTSGDRDPTLISGLPTAKLPTRLPVCRSSSSVFWLPCGVVRRGYCMYCMYCTSDCDVTGVGYAAGITLWRYLLDLFYHVLQQGTLQNTWSTSGLLGYFGVFQLFLQQLRLTNFTFPRY